MPDNLANLLGSREIIDLMQLNQAPNNTTVQDNLDFETKIQHCIEEELCLEEESQRNRWTSKQSIDNK